MDIPTDEQLAEILWNYNRMDLPLEKADVVIVLCSHDLKVADRGAQLLLEGWAPFLLMSGGVGELTAKLFDKPEADLFAERAISQGVPGEKIWIESHSTNTGENVAFSRRLLKHRGRDVKKAIVVQKPYMERRAYATFRKVWPELEVIVTSPQIPFWEYQNEPMSRRDIISIMVGDTQRIKLYPEKGFQIPQEIPGEVWRAYEELVKRGYSDRLVK